MKADRRGFLGALLLAPFAPRLAEAMTTAAVYTRRLYRSRVTFSDAPCDVDSAIADMVYTTGAPRADPVAPAEGGLMAFLPGALLPGALLPGALLPGALLPGAPQPIAHLFSDGQRIVSVEEGGNIPFLTVDNINGRVRGYELPVLTHLSSTDDAEWLGGWVCNDKEWSYAQPRHLRWRDQAEAIRWLLAAARAEARGI